ncbi:hypothetical protein E5D57_003183 [Metarhizium anisopliae]|nr:hypothetical protein E5D57_003183 [Metarhizium anisopliae]
MSSTMSPFFKVRPSTALNRHVPTFVRIAQGVIVLVFVTKDATIITPIAVLVHVTNRIVIRVLATILKGGRSFAQAIAPLRDVAPGLGVSWGVRNSHMRWMV